VSDQPTPEELLARVRQRTEELEQARARMIAEKTPDAAVAYCKAFQARRDAMAALPPLRLVA
jgi:hypothetical protein